MARWSEVTFHFKFFQKIRLNGPHRHFHPFTLHQLTTWPKWSIHKLQHQNRHQQQKQNNNNSKSDKRNSLFYFSNYTDLLYNLLSMTITPSLSQFILIIIKINMWLIFSGLDLSLITSKPLPLSLSLSLSLSHCLTLEQIDLTFSFRFLLQ